MNPVSNSNIQNRDMTDREKLSFLANFVNEANSVIKMKEEENGNETTITLKIVKNSKGLRNNMNMPMSAGPIPSIGMGAPNPGYGFSNGPVMQPTYLSSGPGGSGMGMQPYSDGRSNGP